MAPGPRRNCYTICRLRYCVGLLFPRTRPKRCRGRGDRGCSTGDHLTIDVLRYPGSDVHPGDPDGDWLLRSSLGDRSLAYCRTSGARVRSRRLHRGTAHFFAAGHCSRRPLITAGHPVRSSAPSPSCNRSGFGTPPPHRPAYCTYGCHCPAVRLCRASSISATRETITTPPLNVYSGDHRFSCVGRRGSRPRALRGQVAAPLPARDG